MGSNNTISVVIPCYNGMPYIKKALDSALEQTHPANEIIVVDDLSTDGSAECVKEYASKGVKLIQLETKSYEPGARNAGIKAATSKWIAMLDADDWWKPTKLEKQLAAIDSEDIVLIHAGNIHHYPNGRPEYADLGAPSKRIGKCASALLEPTSICHSSILVRKDALERIGGYDISFERQACDIDLYFRLSAIGTFAFVADYLVYYRHHTEQMSKTKIDQINAYFRAVRKFFSGHPEIEKEIGREHINQKLTEFLAIKIESFYWRRRFKDFRALLEFAKQKNLNNSKIESFRNYAKYPDWLIKLKDMLDSTKGKK